MTLVTLIMMVKILGIIVSVIGGVLSSKRFITWSLRNRQVYESLWLTARGIWPKSDDPIFTPFIPHNQAAHCEICEPGGKVEWQKKHGMLPGARAVSVGGYVPIPAAANNALNGWGSYKVYNNLSASVYDPSNVGALVLPSGSMRHRFQYNTLSGTISEARKALENAAVEEAKAAARKRRPKLMCPSCERHMTQEEQFNPNFPDDWFCANCQKNWPAAALKKLGTCTHRPTVSKPDYCLHCKYASKEVM